MNKAILLLLILSLLLFNSCYQSDADLSKGDNFYTMKGEFDMSRIPLIKPYHALNMIPSKEWIIQSMDTSGISETIPGTQCLNVVDSIIFAYGQKTIIDGQEVKEGWFVIVPNKNLYRAFKTKKQFASYLSASGITEPKMFKARDVFNHFDSKDTLDWKEINK